MIQGEVLRFYSSMSEVIGVTHTQESGNITETCASFLHQKFDASSCTFLVSETSEHN